MSVTIVTENVVGSPNIKCQTFANEKYNPNESKKPNIN